MAQQNPQIRAQNQNKVQLKDLNGEIIMEIGSLEYSMKDSSGAMTRRNINESIQLSTHEFWHPGLTKTMPIGVCMECRRKKTSHGICSLQQSKLCNDCGLLLCPGCRKQSKIDNKYRCTKHHRRHLLKTFLKEIFFQKKV